MTSFIKNIAKHFLYLSLNAANKQRGEYGLRERLKTIVPSIEDQYTEVNISEENKYISTKVRNLHCMQVSMVEKAIELLPVNGKDKPIQIVDIGDSAGTHTLYLQSILADKNVNAEYLSVNLDAEAVKKINNKGLKAIECRAEEVHRHIKDHKTDLFLSFEALEHFLDPISFLRTMATQGQADYFVLTVPYVKKSRVGLHHIRRNRLTKVSAENVHIFELSPDDWNLLFRFSGWEVVCQERYTQYPTWNILSPLKYLWEKIDFNGFYGVVLKRNTQISNLYQSWHNDEELVANEACST